VLNLLCDKFEQVKQSLSGTLSSLASNMSPFANSPELWLTGHIRRLSQEEQATKIQAVTRGYLVRRRQEKERNADDLILDVITRLQPPAHSLSLAELMYAMGLDTWADGLPSAADALKFPHIADKRREAIWHASIVLRLTGRSDLIKDLEWADYYERGRALQAVHELEINPPSLWDRFTKLVWG
jgi:hypothetical protein